MSYIMPYSMRYANSSTDSRFGFLAGRHCEGARRRRVCRHPRPRSSRNDGSDTGRARAVPRCHQRRQHRLPGRNHPRTGALIARSPTSRSLITHPTVIDTLDLVLGDHASTFQVDLTQLVTIGPGEPAQMIHRDQWSFDRYQFPRGFEAEVATMWAVTDFTEEMGATRMVVGSHRWEDDPDEVDPALSSPAVMTKGSVLLYTGSIFHGGGANTTKTSRIGMNVGYSLGWLRQEENQYLACPPEIARTLPEGLLRLMGYQRGSYPSATWTTCENHWTGCMTARRLYRTSTVTAAPLASDSRRPGATFRPRSPARLNPIRLSYRTRHWLRVE